MKIKPMSDRVLVTRVEEEQIFMREDDILAILD